MVQSKKVPQIQSSQKAKGGFLMAFYKEKEYVDYLTIKKELTDLSLETYLKAIRDFFAYIETAGTGYQDVQTIDNITEHEVRLYLNYLVRIKEDGGRGFSYNTRERHLSILRSYFEFLMKQRYIHELPTLGLKLEKVKSKPSRRVEFKWLGELPRVLENETLTMETRLALLLISKRVTIAQMTMAGFSVRLKTFSFSPEEERFIHKYMNYVQPLQNKFESPDLFFKSTMRKNAKGEVPVLMSRTALNKLIAREQARIGFPVNPTQLIREATLAYIQEHSDKSDAFLMDALNITYPYLKNLQKQLVVNGEKQETD